MLAVLLASATVPAPGASPIVLRSERGEFTARISGVEPRLDRLHDLDLSLETARGAPVSGAALALAGQHRYAGNPLPTSPRISTGEAGRYRIAGLRFHMAGEWRLELTIELEQARDRVTFDVLVQ